MWNFKNFFPPRKWLWIITAIILAIIIVYQAIITIFIPIRVNVVILLIEILTFFFVLYRIIWCN